MGKPTLKIGRKKPKRELNPVEQWRKKQKEKRHVKDYLRKLKKKQREQAEEVPAESPAESSSSEDEPIQMKPLTLRTAALTPITAPAPPENAAKPAGQDLFKALLSDDKAVSDFFKDISDLL